MVFMDRNRVSSTGQVAAALNLVPATVQAYARNGRIPFDATPGGHRRFDIEEVRAVLAAKAETPRLRRAPWRPRKPPTRRTTRSRRRRPAQILVCAICLYVKEGIASPADTVIGGMAVCEDHASRAQDAALLRIAADIERERQ